MYVFSNLRFEKSYNIGTAKTFQPNKESFDR
jgi:hypothetical protein